MMKPVGRGIAFRVRSEICSLRLRGGRVPVFCLRMGVFLGIEILEMGNTIGLICKESAESFDCLTLGIGTWNRVGRECKE